MKDDKKKMKHQKLLLELKYLYADLEYHDSFIESAKRGFQEAFMDDCKNEELKSLMFSEKEDVDNKQSSPTESHDPTDKPQEAGEPPPPEPEEPKSPEEEEVHQPSKKNFSKAVKDLYKKIVSQTHPDKLLNALKEEKEHKHSLFLAATKAAEEDNLYELQQIALELGIDLGDFDESQIEIYEKEIEKIKNKINHVKSTFAWVWFDADSEESKDKIMENYSSLLLHNIKQRE
jgi:hypothetical protein